MRKSIATVCLSGSLTEKLTATARAGFDGVEIFENDLLASPLTPEEIRARCADLGLTIDLYQPMRDVEGVPEEEFVRTLRRAEHKFDVMRRLGADTLLVCSSVSPWAVDDDALAAGQLARLADLAQEFGIRVAYEALAWGRHVSTYDHAWRIVETAGHPALGVCLDSFHILSRGSEPKDLEGIADIPGEKIFFLQLADAPLMAMDVLQWSRHYRCFPGQGGLDVTSFVRHVVNAGYRGPLSLEVFNDVFRQADAGSTAVDALRSLIALEESAGLSPLPAPVVPSGVAFAELATADPQPVTELLAGLGFRRTGRHTGKPVELWEQGDARILLNHGTATRGDGTALTALGLEIPDPRAAAHRAESLLAPVLPRRRSGQDVPLDSVAAPDGTELFFCATRHPEHPDWTGDFKAEVHPPQAGSADGNITGVDHVALTQPWHQFDEAVLFHLTVLGLRPHERVDLADPYGLFRSRALSGGTDGAAAPRLVLNLAPSPAAETGTRAQHIAFTTGDIVTAARRIRAAGVELLRIPSNYYEDLDARHAFAPGELDTYRELGILYDRDDRGGEFRHCYTATVGRVFFEIVQRTGGYGGYGAANAPVRLAAQRR
ncbi:bifunctional sugar phosphate isomerase/epimerase/4-hydroxyphenylpyruvate dioxygenase family protein [Streptomyces fulvoviolaceus]|uniref:bifunctional sugar phosphate isomerase/epimerase/4-hydroxyphenylpyruvate dioxygenase family protein n=1 Tax=Streptomyces fulvoviolaceus TaxID=285535 RepID=UPI0004C61907|nr:sugar phosphate isomerase/epimerase and 4-hydroxyphenylpyruvate domain-containing protein [Streptomyces fulvoviolaceus]